MTRLSLASVWPIVHTERDALLTDLRSLTPGQWETASLCPGWNVHDVLAHLIDSAKTTRLGFIRRMVDARFDFDKDNATGLALERRTDPLETLEAFAAIIPLTLTPPAAPATRLVEAFVHGEDIRSPLGIHHDYPAAHVVRALAYQLATSVKMGGGREVAAGWRLVATDTDFTHGTGPEVRGSAISLLLAVSGRPVADAEFTGLDGGGFPGNS